MNFSNLPHEIVTEILDQTPLKDQSKIRSVSKQFHKAISKPRMLAICLTKPSTSEIVDWLWNQSQLLKFQHSRKLALFSPTPNEFTEDDGTHIIFPFVPDDNTKYFAPHINIYLNILTGVLYKKFYDKGYQCNFISLNNPVVTWQELHQTLLNHRLMFDGFFKVYYHMMRDILSLRGSCKNNTFNISVDRCYMRILLDKLLETRWSWAMKKFLDFITEKTQVRMFDDFEKLVGFRPYVAMIWLKEEDHPGQSWASNWLHGWVDRLTTQDLRQDPSVSYLATQYS